MTYRILQGDCSEVLRTLPDASIDACVTDPPYGLSAEPDAAEVLRHWLAGDDYQHRGGGFMGRSWDSFVPGPAVWREVYRVLKPGGHLLAFFGTRTQDLGGMSIRLAGFEIRDTIAWMYGSGFPKSLNVAKQIDGQDARVQRFERAQEFQEWMREHITPQQVNAATGTDMGHHLTTHPTQPVVATAAMFDLLRPLLPEVPERIEELVRIRTVESENMKAREVVGRGNGAGNGSVVGLGSKPSMASEFDVTLAHSPEAQAWEGWGTALKPSHEPVVVARKPLSGTVAGNVLAYGTGALNISACRINSNGDYKSKANGRPSQTGLGDNYDPARANQPDNVGRWPSNVVLGHSEGCVPTGTRRVKPVGATAHRAEHGKGQMLNRGDGVAAHPGYRDADGLETVTAWECEPGCPVAQLGDTARFFATFSACGDESTGDASTSDGASPEAARSIPNPPTDGPGSKPTDPSHPDTRSTTSTGTPSTTTSPTSNSSPQPSTTTSTSANGKTTRSSPASSTAAASDATPTVPSTSSMSDAREPDRGTAGSAPPHTSASGEGAVGTRAFYQAKSSSAERNAGLDGFEEQGHGVGHRAVESGTYMEFVHPAPDGIGAWLREQRLKTKWSTNDLSERFFPSRTGNATGCVRNWEMGLNRPTPEQWRKLREVIGFDDRYDVVMTEQREVPRELFDDRERPKARNVHPTVKPIELMRWLIRLVTPPGGTVLDPFLGSGSTGAAAVLERVEFIGIERDPEYLPIAEARIKWWSEHPDGMQLVKRLEREAERKAVAESGQTSMFDMLAEEPPAPPAGNGRAGEASADRRYTERGASNFAMKPGKRRS